MSTFEPPRITRSEIERFGSTFVEKAAKSGGTLIAAASSETRNDTLDFLSRAYEGQRVVIHREDPAVLMNDAERRREFSQDLFNRSARGEMVVHLFVTTEPDFLVKRQAHPLHERCTYIDLREHMA